MRRNYLIADYLKVSWVPGSGELTIVVLPCLEEAWHFFGIMLIRRSFYGRYRFSGDRGIGRNHCLNDSPAAYPYYCGGDFFVMEAGSVILQVASFKTRGKRIFRMSPIHHHF